MARMKIIVPAKSPSSSQGGFSLVEVIIAILLISIFVVIFLRSETQKWIMVVKSKQESTALEMIQNKVEGLRMAIRANPSATITTDSVSTDTLNGVTLKTTYSKAKGYQTSPPDTNMANVRKISLKATWQAKTKIDSLKVETYVGRDF